MFRKLLLLASMAVLLSGCYMVPLAFVGPATSGYSTTSILQSGFASTANFIVKNGTGKTNLLEGISLFSLVNMSHKSGSLSALIFSQSRDFLH